jgi:hypothetical protein
LGTLCINRYILYGNQSTQSIQLTNQAIACHRLNQGVEQNRLSKK